MKLKNTKGNLLVIAIMGLFCLGVFLYGLFTSFYGLMIIQESAFYFIIGLFFLICIGLPSLYWAISTGHRFISAVPTCIKQRNIRVINPLLLDEEELYSNTEKWLCTVMRDIAIAKKISKTPVVGVELSDNIPNAYSVGATRSNSMVIVTKGLIKHLNHEQIAAVIAHEIGHITNLDTIAKTLLSASWDGVMMILFTPLLFVVWYLGKFVALLMLVAGLIYGFLGNWEYATGYFTGVTIWVLLLLLPSVTQFLVISLTFFHSRKGEYHADAVAARLTSVDAIVSALATLDRLPFQRRKKNREQMSTLWMRVTSKDDTGAFHWLKQSHPPIHKRIEALRRGLYLK